MPSIQDSTILTTQGGGMKNRDFKNHCFLVPAYKKSPYLSACLQSLSNQRHSSSIVISTSTPFKGIEKLAEEYQAELYIHTPNKGIAHDWNAGLEQINSEWVTIAHQDDIYLPTFTSSVLDAISQAKNPSLVFTDYAEIVEDRVRSRTRLLQIKKALLQLGFLGRSVIGDRWSKTNVLRFGSPIPCPSVTLRSQLATPHFELGFKLNMDWAAWLRKAQEPGEFVWVRGVLMHHRIHEDSETSDGIAKGYRIEEDLAILLRMWPKPIAHTIAATYAIAYRSNGN
ncbi:glycosyltransferase family A protein [Hydrogenophaga sp. PAMC20947]|uniref:glycosyltransferase family A protein n=1 Tax=Hydrogenophaga sp. PAMC20947 TaxID=2565558 RepID=UPI00109DE839|nr:glycosyltransferase family A protein [Hydrogenophaga sp. PAMC20947]QCB45752.1 glycosyltransferase family 2 protein [Hydrogenophaga sp. PAMC20947]